MIVLTPEGGGGHSHIGSHQGCRGRMGEFSRPKNLQMGINFCPKARRWVIILIHKASRLVTISIIPPGNGWFSRKLSKSYRNSANFGSCFIAHSLGMGLFFVYRWANFSLRMGQFPNSVAPHPRTKKVEVCFNNECLFSRTIKQPLVHQFNPLIHEYSLAGR